LNYLLKGVLIMKSPAIVVLLFMSLLSACATARFYPVQGPLTEQTPAPVYVAKLTGAFYSGSVSATLSDGEVCKGHWEVVPRPNASTSVGTGGNQSADTLSAEWDTVYGLGYYTAHILGAKLYARSVLTGNRGTVLNLEMYRPDDERDQTPGAI
jgi:hypothetical protein